MRCDTNSTLNQQAHLLLWTLLDYATQVFFFVFFFLLFLFSHSKEAVREARCDPLSDAVFLLTSFLSFVSTLSHPRSLGNR
jgi:hypothetical protein